MDKPPADARTTSADNPGTQPRTVTTVLKPQAVLEGAGVRLKRSFPSRELDYLDPFLLLDHFASTRREDYEEGFPMHPHRGIETVTYILAGEVAHKDTLGNSGTIGAGDVQWMTAGRGILHEEMPLFRPEGVDGFQIWVNLPAKQKMTQPRYQDIRAQAIPAVVRADGTKIKIIAGSVDGVSGPINGIAVEPTCLDVLVPPRTTFAHPIPREHNAMAYVFEGEARFGAETRVGALGLAILGDGDHLSVVTGDNPVRFLLLSGKPLGEPVARHGPFVMNTRAEIEETLRDLRRGTFISA